MTLIGQSKKRQEETHRKWKVKHGTGGVNYKIKQETTEPETAEPNQTTGTALSQHKIEYRSLRNKNCATKLCFVEAYSANVYPGRSYRLFPFSRWYLEEVVV